jgi:hypothetical protein
MVSAVAVRAVARRQCAVKFSLRRFQAECALLPCAEPQPHRRIDLMSAGRTPTMRWKLSRHGHDPRQIDLLAVLALLIIIVASYQYFTHSPEAPSTTAFIEPSQSVHW